MEKKTLRGKGNNSAGTKKMEGRDSEARKLLQTYEKNCIQAKSQMCPGIKKLLKAAGGHEKVPSKFILKPVPLESKDDLPVLFEPFITSLRHERYKHVTDIHVWNYPMTYENIATLALFLERSIYPVKLVELLDCLIDATSISRLARTLNSFNFLTTLVLDYNEFGDDGCKNLCQGLEENKTLLSLSLCYCDLNVKSGNYLGHSISTTAIREIYLDGNELQCEGAMELIKLCVDQAEVEAYQREEETKRKSEEEKLLAEKRKAKKKKAKPPAAPPLIGPWVHKLHLADNGIDGFGDNGCCSAPVVCMMFFKKLVMYSECLKELDLGDNLIGELGGREILDGLKYRKEMKLCGCKVRTTHKMSSETFDSILRFGSRLRKKRKRKGKKRK